MFPFFKKENSKPDIYHYFLKLFFLLCIFPILFFFLFYHLIFLFIFKDAANSLFEIQKDVIVNSIAYQKLKISIKNLEYLENKSSFRHENPNFFIHKNHLFLSLNDYSFIEYFVLFQNIKKEKKNIYQLLITMNSKVDYVDLYPSFLEEKNLLNKSKNIVFSLFPLRYCFFSTHNIQINYIFNFKDYIKNFSMKNIDFYIFMLIGILLIFFYFLASYCARFQNSTEKYFYNFLFHSERKRYVSNNFLYKIFYKPIELQGKKIISQFISSDLENSIFDIKGVKNWEDFYQVNMELMENFSTRVNYLSDLEDQYTKKIDIFPIKRLLSETEYLREDIYLAQQYEIFLKNQYKTGNVLLTNLQNRVIKTLSRCSTNISLYENKKNFKTLMDFLQKNISKVKNEIFNIYFFIQKIHENKKIETELRFIDKSIDLILEEMQNYSLLFFNELQYKELENYINSFLNWKDLLKEEQIKMHNFISESENILVLVEKQSPLLEEILNMNMKFLQAQKKNKEQLKQLSQLLIILRWDLINENEK